jgi:hypothetical protein
VNDEIMMMRMLGGLFGAGGGADWVVIFLFVAAGVLFFLAPVLGYRSDRRGGLATSMYLLVAYTGVSLIQLFVQYIQMLDRDGGGGGRDGGFHLFFIFAIVKMLLFLIAMGMFVGGLQGLRPRHWTEGPAASRPPAEEGGARPW